MPKIKSPSDIQFLALEGGGGKGAAYLGAIQYLELKKVLPININTHNNNQIKGISGASAGALTAFLLALGYNASEIEQILDGKNMPWGGSYDFRQFLDAPMPGTHIILTDKNIIDLESKFWLGGNDFQANLSKLKNFINSDSARGFANFIASSFNSDAKEAFLNNPIYLAFSENLIEDLRKALNVTKDTKLLQYIILTISLFISTYDKFLQKDPKEYRKFKAEIEKLNLVSFLKNPSEYLYTLLFNNGLLIGLEPLILFTLAIKHKIGNKIPLPPENKLDNLNFESILGFSNYANIVNLNFKEFYKITGVDLVLTGTNITDGKPSLFSYRHTPLIPVILAVRLSMGLPTIFRPIWIKAKVDKSVWTPDEDYYIGEWVDGGFLNNFPLHAFDFYPNNPMETRLNPNILGIRLTEPETKKDKDIQPVSFFELLGRLVNTYMYPSESGQIRNQEESEQTVDIDTGGLSTLVFSPPPQVKLPVVVGAFQAMESYFFSGGAGLQIR